MLDGLGMAETTPGPLILVVQFVGFLGAFRDPGGLDPLGPGFWAPSSPPGDIHPLLPLDIPGRAVHRAPARQPHLSAALSAITAAVVGVVLNLAIWFAVNTMFGKVNEVYALGMHLLVPVWGTLNLPSLAIAVFADARHLPLEALDAQDHCRERGTRRRLPPDSAHGGMMRRRAIATKPSLPG